RSAILTQLVIAEHCKSQQHADCRDHKLRENCHRKRSTRAAGVEFRLDSLLKGIDIVLKFAGKELSDLCIETIYVGNQRQQPKQQEERDCDGKVHGAGVARAPLRLRSRQASSADLRRSWRSAA